MNPAAFSEDRAERMILGRDAVYSGDPCRTGLNRNVIVCGSSGSGKTLSFLEPRLLNTYKSSLFLSVAKRRLVQKYAPVFLRRGYRVLDLDFTDPAHSSDGFDPLSHISSCTDVQFLAECIVYADRRHFPSAGDPYFDRAAIELLSALLDYTRRQIRNAALSDTLALLDALRIEEHNGLIRTSLDRRFRELEETAPDCFALRCWNKFLQLPVRTAGCVLSALSTAATALFTPELRKMISAGAAVDFEAAAREKTVVFVTVSPVNRALHTFVNLFFRQAIKDLFEFAERQPTGELPIPVSFLFDDFAVGSRLPDFPECISVFREKNISAAILVQSESQLQSIYGENDAVTIINNCDTYLYTGGMDLKTCRNIGERMNVPTDEVLYLPVGKVVIFRRGARPVITERYPVLEDEAYRAVTAAANDPEFIAHDAPQTAGRNLFSRHSRII